MSARNPTHLASQSFDAAKKKFDDQIEDIRKEIQSTLKKTLDELTEEAKRLPRRTEVGSRERMWSLYKIVEDLSKQYRSLPWVESTTLQIKRQIVESYNPVLYGPVATNFE